MVSNAYLTSFGAPAANYKKEKRVMRTFTLYRATAEAAFALAMGIVLGATAGGAEPMFEEHGELFPGRFPSITVAADGTVLAFGRDDQAQAKYQHV